MVRTDERQCATSTVGLGGRADPCRGKSGSVVTITLGTSVPPGDIVTVDYAVPGAMPVRDAGGNAAAGLDGHEVANVPGAPASLDVTPGDTEVSLDVDGSRVRRWFRHHRVPVPCERRRRWHVESRLDGCAGRS